MSRSAVGPNQRPIQWVPVVLSWEYSGWSLRLITHLC
jgi:hypothetical protein